MRAEAARKRGFLLVELIAVLVIIGSLSCISLHDLSDSPASDRRIIQNEAQNF
ncbi:MAG: type II secretion system GspH family protein, partial [Cloacibacillus sp.]|nr:type II secretion system GspH family protein [Cloacibacillus sp.]